MQIYYKREIQKKEFFYIHLLYGTVIKAFSKLASILLTLSIGPDLLMVIAKSLEKGVKTALYFIAGLMSGLCAHTFLLY